VVGLPHGGYSGNHLHFTDAANIARGDWVWLMNDDCVVNGKGWDTRLKAKTTDQILVPSMHRLGFSHYPYDASCGAVLVPNGAWRKFGYEQFEFPPDTFLHNIFKDAGWKKDFLEVEFWHQRQDDDKRARRYDNSPVEETDFEH
jgi:hypothetical protein